MIVYHGRLHYMVCIYIYVSAYILLVPYLIPHYKLLRPRRTSQINPGFLVRGLYLSYHNVDL